MRLRRPRTITVTFHHDIFELPRNWRPDQVAAFLEHWQHARQPTRQGV